MEEVWGAVYVYVSYLYHHVMYMSVMFIMIPRESMSGRTIAVYLGAGKLVQLPQG